MFKNQDALNDVRRKVAEKLKKDGDKLVFGWRGEPEPTRKEGDVWEDINGKKWTIKNGIRQSVTKLDNAKTPHWCPKCSKPMNHRFDIKFWRIRGYCYDCNIKFESELRRQGKWEEYERKIMLRNYIAEVKDKISELQSYYNEVNKPEFLIMNEHEHTIRMMETWDVDVNKIKEDIQKDIDTLTQILQTTIEKYGTGEDNEEEREIVSGKDETNS
jgi:ribosome-associated translation inhibitor RaiA